MERDASAFKLISIKTYPGDILDEKESFKEVLASQNTVL
jgi:hypothetical protein